MSKPAYIPFDRSVASPETASAQVTPAGPSAPEVGTWPGPITFASGAVMLRRLPRPTSCPALAPLKTGHGKGLNPHQGSRARVLGQKGFRHLAIAPGVGNWNPLRVVNKLTLSTRGFGYPNHLHRRFPHMAK